MQRNRGQYLDYNIRMQWHCGQCDSPDIEWIADLNGTDPYDYYVCLTCNFEDEKNYFKREKLKENNNG